VRLRGIVSRRRDRDADVWEAVREPRPRLVVVVVATVVVDWERVMGKVCGDCVCSKEAERERVIRAGDSSGVGVAVASLGPFLRFDRDEPSEPLSLSSKSFSDCSCDDESRFRVSLTVLEPFDATTFFVL